MKRTGTYEPATIDIDRFIEVLTLELEKKGDVIKPCHCHLYYFQCCRTLTTPAAPTTPSGNEIVSLYDNRRKSNLTSCIKEDDSTVKVTNSTSTTLISEIPSSPQLYLVKQKGHDHSLMLSLILGETLIYFEGILK